VSRGKLFVISAPSGAGKTSLVRALLEQRPALEFSTSYTTRPARANEVDGRDYYFVSHDTFESMIGNDELLEHARVFDNYYGTGRSQVERKLAAAEDVILEIDWQGAAQVRAALPEAETIFVLPPSVAELERRLRSRGTDSDDVIARRLRDSRADIGHWDEFNYVIINDDFSTALAALVDIVDRRLAPSRRVRAQLDSYGRDPVDLAGSLVHFSVPFRKSTRPPE